MKKKNKNIYISTLVITILLCIICYLLCTLIDGTWNSVTDGEPKTAGEPKQTMMYIRGLDGYYYLVCDTSTNIVYLAVDRPHGISVYMNKDGVPARCTEFKEWEGK